VKTVTTIKEIRTVVERWRRNRKTIAFVPTLGALHEGHLALIRAARQAGDRLVVSIFVNPKQFGPGEDGMPGWRPRKRWTCCSPPARRKCIRRISTPP